MLNRGPPTYQLQAGEGLQQPGGEPHPADHAAQRGVLLHLHQGAHLQARLAARRRGGPRRGGRGPDGLRRQVGLLAHHRPHRQGVGPLAYAAIGPRLAVEAEGQRVELVVAGQRAGRRHPGRRRGLAEVRGRVRERLGRVLSD